MSRTAWRIAGILAAVYVLGALPGLAQFSAAQSGTVVSLRGNLALKRARLDTLQIHLNDAVAPGDELITDQNSEAVVKASDGSTVRIFPSSRVIFNEHSGDFQEFLHLFLGSVKIHIEKLSGRPNPQKTTTPSAVIAVRGTTFSVFVDDADATMVAVDEGVVGVANIQTPGEEVLLHRGQRTWVRPGQHPLQAQRFRGRSERADMIPAGNTKTAMNGQGMSGTAMGGAGEMSPGSRGAGGMMGRPGPPH
jgi:ferric-dicitrate binding protein FerR (iron transport regulator)